MIRNSRALRQGERPEPRAKKKRPPEGGLLREVPHEGHFDQKLWRRPNSMPVDFWPEALAGGDATANARPESFLICE